jgi:hypothetical protein
MCVAARLKRQRVHFGDPKTTSLKRNFQEAYLLQFLAKRGAEKAQLEIFGRYEPLKPSIWNFENCKAHI